MAKATKSSLRRDQGALQISTNEEDQGLLTGSAFDDDDEAILGHTGPNDGNTTPKTPRTPNRVRFDLPPQDDHRHSSSLPPSYDEPQVDAPDGRGIPLSGQQRAPLLPESAGSPQRWADNDGELHDHALRQLNRPKSSLRSAMSNMANSIIGAGIIGQPYALKQAGLLTGVTLLIILTIVVDWTIRLIVINSKLSGRDSFQGSVEHCFGRMGLIAISVTQWAFAFGGMIAFGVIVGDSIPPVLEAVWPGMKEVPVLGILANRRGIIFIFIMGISWPLSLYRDIAKVFALILKCVRREKNTDFGIVSKSQHAGIDQHDDYFSYGCNAGIHGTSGI
jgi:solute carrier family 38 (sodium-coupled neutral amino acid transporter), member 11